MENYRELARAIALGDLAEAKMVLDMMARASDGVSHQVDLGRSDATVILARPARPEHRLAA